jgi:hypothetical protein
MAITISEQGNILVDSYRDIWKFIKKEHIDFYKQLKKDVWKMKQIGGHILYDYQEAFNRYKATQHGGAIHQAYNNLRQRRKRIRARIKQMHALTNELYFITFTFTDGVLASTSVDTRRQYVRRHLSKLVNGKGALANIDFGEKNNREHYHAVIPVRYNLDPKYKWRYGLVNVKKVRTDVSDEQRVRSYLQKLESHAIKSYMNASYHLIYVKMNSHR